MIHLPAGTAITIANRRVGEVTAVVQKATDYGTRTHPAWRIDGYSEEHGNFTWIQMHDGGKLSVQMAHDGVCQRCGTKLAFECFSSSEAFRVFQDSGLCPACQDARTNN